MTAHKDDSEMKKREIARSVNRCDEYEAAPVETAHKDADPEMEEQ